MKKITLLLAFLCCLSLSAQKKNVSKQVERLVARGVEFPSFSVLTPVAEFSNKEYKKVVNNAALAKINFSAVNQIVDQKLETIELNIPYHNEILILQLYKVSIFAEGFHVDTNQSKDINYTPGVYYRGIIKGDMNSVAAFNFFNGELSGIVSSQKLSNLVVGKLKTRNNTTDYIIYEDQNLTIEHGFHCTTDDNKLSPTFNANALPRDNANVNTQRCVTMYIEADNAIYQSNGSNELATTNWLSGLFNNMQTLYDNDGITIALKSIFIWKNQDPYIPGGSGDYLDQFYAVRPNFDGDVGSLIGIDPGGLGGLAASIGGLCTNDARSYSDIDPDYQTVPTYSWTVQVLTHENGHVLGSRHTHACVWNGNNTSIDGCAGFQEGDCPAGVIPSPAVRGSIMSYCHLVSGVGISFLNGFGPQPSDAIAGNVDFSNCLSTGCTGACINRVDNIDVDMLTADSAAITWTDSTNPAEWELSVTAVGDEFELAESAFTPSWTAFDLMPNTEYRVKIRPLCTQNLATGYREFIFNTANMSIGENSKLSFTYYPNPTNGLVAIDAKSEISDVYVYNIEGRLLYHNNVKASTTKVDLSAFASGTYFFKLVGEGSQANFKILKM